jgi:hypothetical protein
MTNFSNAKGIVDYQKIEKIYMGNISQWERILKDFKVNEKLL